MRKSIFFSYVLSLLLLVPASITWAQTITSQKGLTTALFNTDYGIIKVYLPENIRPGELISGTIEAEPKGSNTRQIEKNLAELKKYTISFNNEKFPVGIIENLFSFIAHKDRQFFQVIELHHISGQKPFTLSVPSGGSGDSDPRDFLIWQSSSSEGQNELNRCIVPTHALTDAPMRITGPFDGDASNTKCTLNGQPMQVLVESSSQCQVLYPAYGQGLKTFHVSENGQEKCTRQTSGVDMQVTTGNLKLKKGQSTFIDIKITGLENLPDKATLTVTNITPSVVSMTNGNLQIIPIWPLKDSAGGVFSLHCSAVSLNAGTFSVNINLDLPELTADSIQRYSLTNKENNPGSTPGVNFFNEKVAGIEDSLKRKKDELEQKKRERDITIDDEIKKAEKEKRDCEKELEEAKKKAAAAAEALEKAKQKRENIEKNIGPGKTFPDKDAAKKQFGDYEKAYEDAKKASDAANINLTGLKKKCPELTKALEKLRNRKTEALPAEIEKSEKDVKELEEELEREKTIAEDEKKRQEDEQKKKEELERQKTQAEKDAQDAKYKTKAENIYLLQNIYSLGLISSKIWETPGLMDWLPDALEKPIGDAAEDLVKTPIPLDAITAIAGLYGVVGAKLDPCTAEGSITTIKRLKGMKNSKTGINYTDDEALDKTDRMCELLKKLKAIAAAAKK